MDVTETSPNQFTIEGGFPPWWGLFVLGPLFMAVVFLALWQPTTLTCERGGDCTLEASSLLGTETERFPAAGLRHATVATSRSGRRTATYRVELALASGVKPLTEVYGSERARMARDAEAINAFVAGAGGARLVVAGDERWVLWTGLGLLALTVALTYFVPRRYRTVIDGEAREIRHRATWLGLGRERRVAFGDVMGVDVGPRRVPINGRRGYRATLRTSGAPVVLGYGLDPAAMDADLTPVRAIL